MDTEPSESPKVVPEDALPVPPELDIDLLDEAWQRVRSKGGAAGVDGIDLRLFDADLSANLQALLADLQRGAYRPQAYRLVEIPKPSGGHRRIVIATVRDRVAQTAIAAIASPLIEPLLHPCSYAYRSGRGVQDALQKVAEYRNRGFTHVLGADIEQFFDRVRHDRLMEIVEAAELPPAVPAWIEAWLRAPVVDRSGIAQTPTLGLPQGLPIAPLLANLYLTAFDRTMVEAGWKLVRYADDFVICTKDAAAADQARSEAEAALEPLGLTLSAGKTTIHSFQEGFVFLGARFVGNDVFPAVAHPYEPDYTPPPPRRPQRPPRQALPAKLQRTLYLQEQGSRLGCHGDRLVIRRGEKTLLDVPARHISQIFIFGRVHITAAAMAFCLTRRIPVHLFSGRGRYFGVLRAVEESHHTLHRAQFTRMEDPVERLGCARTIVKAKITQQRRLLERFARNHPEAELQDAVQSLKTSLNRAVDAADLSQLLGIEGNAAAAYYAAYARCFRGSLNFVHRIRRPPTDPVNSLLSFGYTLVFYQLHSLLCARGLDPALGMLHEARQSHPALASDLIEEFRAPIVDALVLGLANRGQFTPADFYFAEGDPQPCFLKDESRVRFLEAFEAKMGDLIRHPDLPHPVDWRRVLDLQVGRYRRYIEGAVDRYVPFTPR